MGERGRGGEAAEVEIKNYKCFVFNSGGVFSLFLSFSVPHTRTNFSANKKIRSVKE